MRLFLALVLSISLLQAKTIPKSAKCPVCGMWVSKYPKWVATIKYEDNSSLYFDGVKDMMKFYLEPTRFKHQIKKISSITVIDYYSLKSIDAKKAYYVSGSNVYGPMGVELIPFLKEDDAKAFKDDHEGKRVIRFSQITKDMLY